MSVHLYCMYFFTLLGNHTPAHLQQRRHPPEFLSSPLTHLSTALQAATTHFSAVRARELKLWVCCHPQRAPRTYKRYRFFKQVSTSTNLTFNYSSLRDDTFVGKTCPSLPTPRRQRGKDSGTWRLGEATEKQWKSEEKRTLPLQDAHRIGCTFNTSFLLSPLFSCLLYRGGDCSDLSVKRFPLQLNKDPQPRRSSLFPSSSFPPKKREQNSAARGTLLKCLILQKYVIFNKPILIVH